MGPKSAANNGYSGGEFFCADNGFHGGSDNPGRDECGDTKYSVVLGVMVADAEAMVPNTAGNSSDSGGDVIYAGDGGSGGSDDAEDDGSGCKGFSSDRNGRGNSDYPGHDEGSDVVKKVMTARVVVAMVADAVAKAKGSDGSQDFGNYCDSGCKAGEVTAVVGSSDGPGRDKGSDVALEAMTVDFIEAKTSVITATAAATFLAAMEVVTAVAIAMTPDSTRKVRVPKIVAITATVDAKVLTTTTMVAATAIILDATGDCGGRGNSDNPRRDEGIDADWKAITTVVVVAMVADAALIICDATEHSGNYGDGGGNISYGDGDGRDETDGAEDCGDYGESFYSDRGGRGGSDYPGLDEGSKVSLEAMTAVVAPRIVADDSIEAKTSAITATAAATFLSANEVVAAVAITPDSTRTSTITATSVSNGTGGGAALAMTQDAEMEGSDGSQNFDNYGDSGCKAGEVTAVVGGSDDPGRVEAAMSP
ncbi:hypothetical protein Bbelb_021080 [Branchiostoma belcheri]|nr:hypothetical protein Bbelb_021080 [Branchiostoma belcheri]